jgi:predicted PurR-regulated permease PerM
MNDSQRWLIFACLVGFGILIYLLSPVLTPFLVAALLAYLGDPLVDRLEAKMPRSLAVTIVFICLFVVVGALLVLLLPALQQQVVALIKGLPRYIEWLQVNAAPWLQQNLGLDISLLNLETLKAAAKSHWQQVGGIAANIMNVISQSGMAMMAWLANLVLIPVVTFYLLRDWDELVAAVHELLPRHLEPTVSKLSKESDEVLGAFVRGQLMVMLALGTVYAVGLWIVGLDLALLIGMIAGVVSFVPYLGFILGFILAAVATILQFHDAMQLLPVLAVFGVGQVLEGMLLTPLLVGDKIGLHPVAVIFAVMAGGQLFGFVGILIALPVAAVIMVLLRHVHDRYRQSGLYTKADSPEVS